MRLVAELLLEKETITHDDVARLIGARRWSAGKEYDEFVSRGSSAEMSHPQHTETGTSDAKSDSDDPEESGGGPAAVGPVAVTL